MPGLFITFEGGEGSGKTTQVMALVVYLRSTGREVVATRDPGGTPIGKLIRTLLLDRDHTQMAPTAELLLYQASRAQLVHEVIRPALAADRIVLCDRFTDSTVAYQGYGRKLDLDLIAVLDHSSRKHRFDIQFGAGFLRIDVFSLEPENSAPRNHLQFMNMGETVDDALRYAITQIFRRLISACIHQRQDSKRIKRAGG